MEWQPKVRAAIEGRMAVYRQKQARRDPFGEDMFNSWDQCQHAVEVLEYLADGLGIQVTDPVDNEKEHRGNENSS
jgi:hypothetical protein